MVSKLEQELSCRLRATLDSLANSVSIPETNQFREALLCLEYFIPGILAEIYREWNFLGLDGIEPVLARRTGEGEAEILGLCCFISDQTWTPIHIHLQIGTSEDEISWFECRLGECRLGEQGQHEMVRIASHSRRSMINRLHRLEGRTDQIDWVYKVTFGSRRQERESRV
jgi:hypothetical protein